MSSQNIATVIFNINMNNFKNRLKDLRIERNLKQTDMAKLTGFGQSTIAQWENGSRIPSAEAIVVLAKFFKCSADYLLGLED